MMGAGGDSVAGGVPAQPVAAKPWDDAWVLDASLDRGDGLHCFIPVELDQNGEVTSFVVGMNFISTDPPELCQRLLGVIHEDGQEAVDQWCAENEAEMHRLFGERVA